MISKNWFTERKFIKFQFSYMKDEKGLMHKSVQPF